MPNLQQTMAAKSSASKIEATLMANFGKEMGQ
jgi:hypothetical protein